MQKREIISNLKKLQQIKPRTEWINQNREILLSHINTTKKRGVITHDKVIEGLKLIFKPRLMSFMLQPIVVSIIVLCVLFSGFATVSAAKNSLPGDLFYNFKIATEKAQVSLALNEVSKAQLEVEFAGRRSEELNFLIYKKGNQPQKNQDAQQTVQYLKKNIDAAKKRVATLKDKEPQKAVDVAKKIDAQTKELGQDLNQTKNNLETQQNNDLHKTINDAIKTVEEADDKMVEVIVEKHVSGEVTQDEAEIKGLLEEKLNKVQEKVVEMQDKITIVNNKLQNEVIQKSEIGKANIPTNLPNVTKKEVTTEQPLIEPQANLNEINEIASLSENVEKMTQVTTKGEDAHQILQEAGNSLENNNYQETIDKIKLGKNIVNEAEQTLEEITTLADTGTEQETDKINNKIELEQKQPEQQLNEKNKTSETTEPEEIKKTISEKQEKKTEPEKTTIKN